MEADNKNITLPELTIEQYKHIVNSSPMMVFKLNSDYRITYVNLTVESKSTFKKEDLLGKTILELGVNPDKADIIFFNYKKVFDTAEPQSFIIELGKGKDRRLYSAYLAPDIIKNGKVENLILYVDDITNQKLIEDERDYFFNFSIDLFAVLDKHGNFLKINPSWTDVLGWTKEELIGKNWKKFIHKDDNPYLDNDFNGSIENQLIVNYETQYKTKDGNFKWLEWNSIPVKDREIIVSVVRDITSFKAFEKKLKDSERQYREVVEKANDIIFSIDLDGNITFANNASQKFTEYSEEELLTKNVKDIVGDKHRNQVKFTMLKQYLSKEQSSLTEYSIITKSGKTRWFSQNATLRFNDLNEPIGFDVIARDITKQIDVEIKLLESQEQLRTIVNSANDIILQITDDGIISDSNNTAYDKLKTRENILIGKDFRTYIDDKESLIKFEQFLRDYKDKKSVKGVISINDSHGNVLKFKTNGIKFKRDGNLYLLIFMTDITRLEKAKSVTQVLYNIARQVNFAENLDDLFGTVHSEVSDIIEADNFIIAQYEQKDDNIYFPYFQDEKDSKFEIQNVSSSPTLSAEVIRTKSSILLGHKELVQHYGTSEKTKYGTMPKSWIGVPLLIKDKVFGAIIVQSYENEFAYELQDREVLESIGEQLAIAISKIRSQNKLIQLNKTLEKRVLKRTEQLEKTLEDLNYENEERKKTQIQLRKAKDDLDKALEQEKELNNLKSKFISMVSHEYRTPLTVIMSSVNLLDTYRHKMSPEQIDKQLQNITASVKSMTQLLDDVLMMGRAESTRLSLTHFNVNMLIDDIIHNIKFIDNYSHKFQFIAEQDFDIYCDKKLLGHIFNNIISNAVKYSDDDTTVKVELDQSDIYTIFRVTDEGIGIPKEDLENIFQAFYRSSNVGSIEGTGLGMSIVKQSVDTLQGSIDIQTSKNGTTFTVKIPNRKNESPAT